jgi:hypothetical protein
MPPSFPDRKVQTPQAPISAHLARAVTVLVGFQQTMLGAFEIGLSGAQRTSGFEPALFHRRAPAPSTAVVPHLDVHARPPCADKARKAGLLVLISGASRDVHHTHM